MSGLTIKLDNTPIIRPAPTPVQIGDGAICACDLAKEYEELVFASDNAIEADLSDFLYRKITAGDVVELELQRYSKKVADLNDDTFGTYFNGFTEQPLYLGYVLDWTKVFNAFGGGQYRVVANVTLLGTSSTVESRAFRLSTFDQVIADRTVKIRAVQQGNIVGNEFDFTGLNRGEGWTSYLRLPGEFGRNAPTLERDEYQDRNYRQVQNRDSVTNEYTLVVQRIPEGLYDLITNYICLANNIVVTTFNLLQDKQYTLKEVVPQAFSSQAYDKQGRVTAEITFADRVQNIIKRNF